jgi:uncharacterized phage protein gp47/JayE
MEYGLTEKGFVAKPFPVILEEERQSWKEMFGYDIDTSADTPEGAYVSNQAIKLTQVWEMMEALWAAGDPDTASGVYLDRLVSLVNVERESAQSTRVYAALWGKENSEILAGHLARLSTGEQFELQEGIVINRENLLGFHFKVSEISQSTYSFLLSGRMISYDANEEESEESIQSGLFDQIDALFPSEYVKVNQGADGMEVRSAVGIVPFGLFCDDPKIEIDSLGTLGIYRAIVPGNLFAGIGTLNQVISKVDGLDSIINYATGITGRNKESDAELRIEKNNRQKQASGNERAIQNAIEKEVDGVQYCKIYSNRTMTESNGRPPKSYETVVVGGVDNEIAQKIFDKGPAGVEPCGNTRVSITDSEGFSWEIGFTRPENQFIWIKILYELNPEESFPINGIEMIKDYIDEWGAANQKVGVDFIYQKLNTPVFRVPGIGKVEISVAATTDITASPAEEDYLKNNIIINERQIAVIDKTRVAVLESELLRGVDKQEIKE